MLSFRGFISFARKNMDYGEKYELLGTLLEDEKVYMNPGMTFETVCRWMGVCPKRMDEYVYSSVGMSGNEVIEIYRNSVAPYFLEKYGIVI